MEYGIYTFGNGEVLKGIFDSIAMLMNSHSGSLYQPFIRITLIVGAFWAALYAIYGEGVKVFTGWILPSLGILNLLFAPQATVRIIDTSPFVYQDRVQHVPYGLAMFGHYVSLIGKVMTEEVEKVFSMPDDLKYHKSGMLFASNIIQQAKSFRITNEDMAENMRQFVGQCVVYDALLGVKYTIQDLRNTSDIWKLVSERPSPVRSFYWKDPATKTRPVIVTCKEGVRLLNQNWTEVVAKGSESVAKKIFGSRPNKQEKAELWKYLPMSYEVLGNYSRSAGEIIRQQMMIHSVVDGIEQRSTALGNAPNFAARRAYLQQRATYETLGTLAADTLPAMKAVFEGLAYAAFIFVLPLALLPFGYRFLMSWAQILLWLQMWAPLYAILNYMMMAVTRSKAIAHLSLSTDMGVTIASSVGLTNLNADMASMAGYLAISIPFLSIALVKGVGSFVHMASHLGGVSQSTAQTAAAEAVTGNYSFGNMTEGSVQIANTQMMQQNRAASYRSGSFQKSDGQYDTITTSDGTQISNVVTSNIPMGINVSESMSNQYSENASRSYQQGMSLSESASKTQADSFRQYADLSDHLRSSDSLSQSNTKGISTEDSQAINKTAQMIEEFGKTHNLSRERSADVLAQASVSSGSWGPFSASGSTSLKGNAVDSNLLSEAKRFLDQNEFQESMKSAASASQNIAHSTSDEKTKQLAEGASGSYEKSEQLRSEAGKSFSEAESYQKQANHVKANSASIDYSYKQEFVEWLSKQPADNAPGTLGTSGASYMIARQPQLAAKYAQQFLQEKGLEPKAQSDISPASVRQQYDQGHVSSMPAHQSIDAVREQGSGLAYDDRRGSDVDRSVQGSISAAVPKIEEARASGSQAQQSLKEQHAQKKEEYLIPQAAAQLGGDWGKSAASGIATAVSWLGGDRDSQGEKITNDVYPQPTGQTQIVQSSGGGEQSVGNSGTYRPTEERSSGRYDPALDSSIALSERRKDEGFVDEGGSQQSHQRTDQAQRHEQFGPRRTLSSERSLPKDDRFNKEAEAPSKDDIQIINNTSPQNPRGRK